MLEESTLSYNSEISMGAKALSASVCEACGQENRREALFCRRCTAPVAVAALGEFDADDQRLCLRALFEVLSESTAGRRRSVADDRLWRNYLSAFWLRPETALVLYAEALAVRAALSRARGPHLDLGCGDGIHAALRGGWRFTDDFDAFQSLDPSARDIYNAWNPKDFRAVTVHRARKIDFGVDIKPTAVSRAKALGAFSRVERADATRLPLKDSSVGSIFSNMLRDLGEPLPAALSECRRVLKDDGVLLISAMTPEYPRRLYFAPAALRAEKKGESAMARRLLRLDRGRSVFCRRQLTAPQWQTLLRKSGFKLEGVRPLIGSRVIRFWDVGLRPFSLPLLNARRRWDKDGSLVRIKRMLVGALAHALAPLAAGVLDGKPCMHLIVARKA
jgi:SAM-dependent methyltransferase